MPFFKQTFSYEIISIIDEMVVRHKFINYFKYWIKLRIYEFKNKRKIKSKEIDKVQLLKEFFKERFYLEQLNENNWTLGNPSTLQYSIINNIIICNITYGPTLSAHIEYGPKDGSFSVFVHTTGNRGVIISESTINTEFNYNLCIDLLNIMNYDVCIIFGNIMNNTILKVRKVKKDV